MIGLEAFYIAGLATLAGYLLIGRVPSVLFTPLLAGAKRASTRAPVAPPSDRRS